jgi:hypothetical protein
MGLGVYITWLVHSRAFIDILVEPDTDQDDHPAGDPPLISVIIPARNEGRNISRCVQALFGQTYPNYEIIVVDDRSSDETPNILSDIKKKDPRLHIIHGAELPPGWAGKPHALVQGAAAAHGEWLCFMDADTFAESGLLWSTYRMAVKMDADMFSILTDQELGSFWERAILPLVFLGLSFGFPAQRVNDPNTPDAIANGQFILIKRSVYDQVGGHGAVKDRVDEDKAIGRDTGWSWRMGVRSPERACIPPSPRCGKVGPRIFTWGCRIGCGCYCLVLFWVWWSPYCSPSGCWEAWFGSPQEVVSLLQ